MKIIYSVIVIIVLSILVLTQINRRNNKDTFKNIAQISAPSPSPFPFQELTIPYLRARSYDSSLNELTKISQNNVYTSYLTSFDSDGFKINGLLTIPNNKAKHPAIIFIHGYIPPTLYKTQEKYTNYVDYLAKNGFVVFKIDLRGHGESEGEAGGAYYSSDYTIDTINAYKALQKAEFVDSTRIGLWGHSMAGNVVLKSVAVKPDIPAAVIWAGAGFTYQDLVDYGISDASYRPPLIATKSSNRRRELFAQKGEFNSTNEFYKTIVPTNYLGDYKGAIELHHTIDDIVVSIEYSRNLNKILNETNIPHQLYEYQKGGHNIQDPSFSLAMSRTVTFFNNYLK